MKMCGDWRYKFHAFLISALDGGEWSDSCSDRFIPGERAPIIDHKSSPRRREPNQYSPVIQETTPEVEVWWHDGKLTLETGLQEQLLHDWRQNVFPCVSLECNMAAAILRSKHDLLCIKLLTGHSRCFQLYVNRFEAATK
jgi:hypothetical protein